MEEIHKYLKRKFGASVDVVRVGELAPQGEQELKGFGYGKPYLVVFEVQGKKTEAVLSSMRGDQFGHEHFADRAQVLLWQYSAFNKLRRHVRALDVGYFAHDGSLKSVSDAAEFFLLCEKAEGVEYYKDLERISKEGLRPLDEQRAAALAEYLAEIHAERGGEQHRALYVRRVRELVGHGECIFGLVDSYFADGTSCLDFMSEDDFLELEKICVEWRWRLRKKTHRVCVVHGDFHPWNVLFRQGTDFTVLDRSRGEWGEAADDVSSMTINYIFCSLLKYGKLEKEFKKLFDVFFEKYLERTGDEGLLEVIQPFYAFRGLVIASPLWYPHISTEVRMKIFRFIRNVLAAEKFELSGVNEYFKD